MSGRARDLAPCGVRHVAIAAPFADIAAAPGERSLYVVFWRHGHPVGSRLLLAAELPVPAAAVPALAADAAGRAEAMKVRAEAPPEDSGPPRRVSVVVCTRDRPEDLRRCLTALARCAPAPAEIIVVDNAPTDDAARTVAETFPAVRYLREPRCGLSHARNTGVKAAVGEVVAFTDDDAEVAPDWIARGAAPFVDPAVACVTGAVLPASLAADAACRFEFEIGGFGKELAQRRFDAAALERSWWRAPEVWKIGAGANMMIRRRVFAEVGLFDPRLGAGASGCSEDSELWFRLLRAGRICRYDPAAVVFHHHRPDWPGLARQLRGYARGHLTALFVQFAQDRRPCHLIRAFATMPWHYLKLVAHAVYHADRTGFALARPQIGGYLEGLVQAVHRLRGGGPPRLDAPGVAP